MDEYIKRETLLNIAKKLQGDDAFGVVRIVREIENAPAEDVVEVKHGAWKCAYEGFHDITLIICSICGRTGQKHFGYCPGCGAKMDI